MTNKTIKEFGIGAFPSDLRRLFNEFSLDPVELRENGIIWNAEHSQFKLYPIVIPITDIHGSPIAIGCRTLISESERKDIGLPKYKNSVYKKTSNLFALNKSYQSIRKNNLAIVVEGYFDAISAHQNKITNVVATCGTMFGKKQLAILSRYTNNICLLFDNDAPGRTSAIKAEKNLKDIDGAKIFLRFTPDGYKDLDEFLRNGGDYNTLFKDSNV